MPKSAYNFPFVDLIGPLCLYAKNWHTINIKGEARTATPIILVHTNSRHYYCCTQNSTSDRATILQILKYLLHKKVYVSHPGER